MFLTLVAPVVASGELDGGAAEVGLPNLADLAVHLDLGALEVEVVLVLAEERVVHDLRGDLQVDVVEAEDLVPLGEVLAAGSTDGRVLASPLLVDGTVANRATTLDERDVLHCYLLVVSMGMNIS